MAKEAYSRHHIRLCVITLSFILFKINVKLRSYSYFMFSK
uniref:Uncharacterized protein n=1 Tax=Lepeophtheirus salmonis TaxID=72036 RepID=A0A0K2UCW3_LEPSM